ncbi:hypothetical protein SCHPADRAFT_894919 [Schizopora paradoxa]|uniref:MYND-type domain-containing protein n=1 Tax=Schizopora paradoxa TaxID=27342 RepID=A0A0H2R5Q0_9AGAM|nr:hypothetical protein SCHPADRAFT_894919 [Schizopora paradoxa]
MYARSIQLVRERAKRSQQHTDREIRRIMSTMLPKARNGHLQDLRYFVDGVREFPEFIVPEVFEAFLEQLHASKVPAIETLPASFVMRADRSFKDPRVHRAFQGLCGLANSAIFQHLLQAKFELVDIFVSRWPDVLSWMWYFYIACFERNLVDGVHQAHIYREIPGSVRLATLLCMLDNKGAFLNQEDVSMGTHALSRLLPSKANPGLLDEVTKALGGNAKLLVDATIARLEQALDTPKIADKVATTYVPFFVGLNSDSKHPICVALRDRKPVAILTNVLHRLLELLPQASSGRLDPDSAAKIHRLIGTILSHISIVLRGDSARSELVQQALQAGLLTILIDCAPIAFTLKKDERDAIVEVLKQLTWLTTHLPVARQASAELERLERARSIQGRFNVSTPDVRIAWMTLYDAILARRSILAQMQALNSTPMSCDNCFRFDERAKYKKCAGCGQAHYCSKDCQGRAWKERGHRDECKSMKNKPAKRRRRAMNQEKYFLARVAVNDAQHKKEELKQMVDIGLKNISVSVDYTEFPPLCLVEYDMKELDSYTKHSSALMDVTTSWLERCGFAQPQQSDPSLEGTSLLAHGEEIPLVARRLSEGEGFDVVHSDGEAIIRIHLVDDNALSETASGPAVHITVHLPAEDGAIHSRKEHFVIDDFWEFMHIKFESSEAEFSEDFQKTDENSKCVVGSGRYPTDKMARLALLLESQRTEKAKELACAVDKYQGDLSRHIK